MIRAEYFRSERDKHTAAQPAQRREKRPPCSARRRDSQARRAAVATLPILGPAAVSLPGGRLNAFGAVGSALKQDGAFWNVAGEGGGAAELFSCLFVAAELG